MGWQKTLNDNKCVQCDVQLITKHAILTTTISAHTTSLIRGVVKTLGVHHKNVMRAISWRMLMDVNCFSLWSLSTRKKRIDGLLGLVKEAIIN